MNDEQNLGQVAPSVADIGYYFLQSKVFYLF